jgi:choline kinase
MRALIFAAGIGRRLGPLGTDQPKCLLEFEDKSLLARHMYAIESLGIESVVIGVGHRDEMIRAELEAISPGLEVTIVYNPDYTQGSIVSLWSLRKHLTVGGDVLLMDADVLYDLAILKRLSITDIPNCFLLDRDFEPGDEPVKLCVRDGVLVEFRKQLDAQLRFDFSGESVGFFRLSEDMARRLAQQCETYIVDKRYEEPYEEAIRDLLLDTPAAFGYEDITELPWIEIDFPADIERAKREILPRIAAGKNKDA